MIFFDYNSPVQLQHVLRGNSEIASLIPRRIRGEGQKNLKEYYMAKKAPSKFMQPMKLSPELQAVVGKGPMPRTEVTKKLWAYIKENKRQDPKNKRLINPDEKLAKILGKKPINMFDMTKEVSKHLS